MSVSAPSSLLHRLQSEVATMSLSTPTASDDDNGTDLVDESGRRGCARMVVSSMVSEVCRRMVPLPRLRVEVDAMEVVLVWAVDVDDREQ